MLLFTPDNIFRNATNENDYRPVYFQIDCDKGMTACLKKAASFVACRPAAPP
jgi:hypothetical protein